MTLRSFRGDGPWKGRSTRSTQDRGDRRLRLVEGGYVSSDGHEIRSMPGFHTLLDLTADNNSNGYERRIVDSRRPVFDWSQSNSLYQYYAHTSQQTVVSFSKPTHIHGFEQMHGRLLVWGESDFRRDPIYDVARTELTVIGLHVTSSWNLQLASTPGPYSVTDTSAAGGNGLLVGDVVYVEIDSTSTILSPFALHEIDHFFGIVSGIVADTQHVGKAFITLQIASAAAVTSSPHPTTGRVFRTRCNMSDIYPVSPNEQNVLNRIDDPEALTLWTVADALDLDNPATLKAQPAWVANRQRDHGDQEAASLIEGAEVTPGRGVSRRRQKSLPFRTNPEVAGNRLILAAPGYACIFQCPIIVPTAAENYPSPLEWSPGGGPGAVHWFNDLHDKPRALGVPKAILVDSTITPAPVSSPSTWAAQAPYNFNVYGINSPGVGWTPGTYRFAITYYDDFTGEEGLPSEEVSITVPSSGTGGHSYGIQLTYFHPGYLYPEILTLSLNIYFASNTVEPLGFYKRVPLQVGPISTPNASSKYGFTAGGSPEATVPQQTLYQTFQLQPPLNSSPYSSARDTSRLAPQSLQMPKGAECFRVIRGIPLSVGHTGTHGLVGELTGAKSSAILDPSTPVLRTAENEVIVRFSNSPSVDLVGATLDGPFGLASRVFPPAYEGVGLFSSELYPAPRQLLFVDRVLNCKTHNTNSVLERHQAYEQRLRMDESVFDKDKGDAGSPFRQTRNFKQVYLEEPKTQVQVGEPGRPEVAIATAIQIIDPNRDDDGFAIGNLGGQAIICTKEETFSLAWARAPQGNVPQSVTNEHGCVGTNSMTQFDGGLCWLGKRGPCAMMPQFDFVGADLEHDFTGSKRRYLSDSRGFMRHAWSCHDRSRGLVLWGLVTTQATHTINWHGTAVTFSAAPDQAKSRFPCDEVLIWSYRAQAFSRWRPPSGMEIFWMRPVKDKNGDERLSFLAADNRIYAFDEEWNDTNRSLFQSSITGIGNASTVLTTVSSFAVDGNGGATARGTGDNLVRVGMSVLIFDSEGQVVAKTTVAAATAPNTITLTAASSWGFGATLEIGHRSDLRVVTTFAGDSADNLEVESVQARYALAGEGLRAWAQVQVNKSDLRDASQTTDYSQEPSVWKKLGIAEDTLYGARRTLAEGRTVAPEIAVDVTFTGGAQVRLTDLAVDVKSGS